MKAHLPDLSGFTGSETVYRHPLMRGLRYTEGVKHLAETIGAYWLIDFIGSHQTNPRIKAEGFQVWRLKTSDSGSRASIVCDDGDDGVVFEHEIEFTTFPPPGIDLYFTNDTLLLPSEY